MKDWQKRRDIESLNNPQTRSFINGWNAGRTDTLSELSFVRKTLIKISKDRCVHVSGEATNIPTWSADEANKAMEKLDALIKNN